MNETKSTRGVTLRVMFVAALVLLFAAVSVGAVSAEETWADHAADSFAEGSGDGSSAEAAILIENAGQLAHLAKLVNDGDCYSDGMFFELTDDIDLGLYEWIPIGYLGSGSDDPAYDGKRSFRGYFDGNGKNISNLKITSDLEKSGLGLFGCSYKGDAVISDLTLVNVEISGNNDLGALVGDLRYGTKKIENCVVSGTVKITANGDGSLSGVRAGGLVGVSHGNTISISNCHVNVNPGSFVQSANMAGGISGGEGANVALTITNCTSNIDVKGTSKLGGIIGQIYEKSTDKTLITNVKSCGNIIVTAPNGAGGYGTIVGALSISSSDLVEITDSESHGSIVGWSNIASKEKVGLLGWRYGDDASTHRACVSECYYYATSDDDVANLVRVGDTNELNTGGTLIIGGSSDTKSSSEVKYKGMLAYTVTIPSTFDFGSNLALQSAVSITVQVTDATKKVKMTVTPKPSDGRNLKLMNDDGTLAPYTFALFDTPSVEIVEHVFTADGFDSNKQEKKILFTLDRRPTKAGVYTDTLTFTTEVINAN